MPVERLTVGAYRVPTESPESDGTLAWDATTLVLVTLDAAGEQGLGYTYADAATARLIADTLAPIVVHQDAFAVAQRWVDMTVAVRNLGRSGIAWMAVSAVDAALWDLKAKLLEVPLAALLGTARDRIPVYGSGGFTSYTVAELQQQLAGWVDSGIVRVKMKVGREPAADVARVRAARQAIGAPVELFVDANGAYRREEALAFAESFAAARVTWFEEPVSSDDLAGLRRIAERSPAGMAVAAGEYGYDLPYFRRMLEAQAVDVLQADATRCGGVTGFMHVAVLCDACGIPLSSHCAPALHLPLCVAATTAVHLEWFHDHVRIERLLFDGAQEPRGGALVPDATRPGIGVEFRHQDAKRYAL